jgi:3-hydroxyisobutyrate dehydrogenase-like beta-hydroxyacid dehydrogenase
MTAKVSFLGLGVMGFPMAGHLKAKGYDVTVYNRTAAKASEWAKKHGGRTAPTPAAAAKDADLVMVMVGNDNDVEQVILGKDGALAGMTKGAVLVDHTTASADVARKVFAAAKKAGLDVNLELD